MNVNIETVSELLAKTIGSTKEYAKELLIKMVNEYQEESNYGK